MQAYRKSLILTVALAAALSLVTPRPCAAQPQPPLPTDLGMLPGFSGSMAIAINANGQVVGWNSNDTTNQAFIWQNGVMTALPKPPGSDSCWAYDINASGRIAGACRIAKTQRTQASLWQVVRGAWTVTSPRIPAGWAYSMAYSINDNGEVLGMLNSSINNSGTPGGFYWEPSTTLTVLKDAQGQSIIPLQVSVGKPLPINANGQILGFLVNTGELVIWKAGAVTDLGVGYPQMASMNNNGEVVGVSNYVSFLYLPAAKYGKSQGLNTLSDGNFYLAINDSWVVAYLDPSGQLFIIDLSNPNPIPILITSFTPDQYVQSLMINASGTVAGYYADSSGETTGAFYGWYDATGPSGGYYPLLGWGGANPFVVDLSDSGGVAGFSVPDLSSYTEEATAWAVTVTPAPLTISGATAARKGGAVTVTVALKNNGTSTADNVLVYAAVLVPVDSSGNQTGDQAPSSSTPVSLKSIDPGATRTLSLKFMGSSVPAGTYKIAVMGTCSLGAFEPEMPIVVP